MSSPSPSRDALPRSSVMRALLEERDGAVAVTLELPDGAVEDFSAPDTTEARGALLVAARRFLKDQEHTFGRLTVADGDREWELALPADPTQEPVVLLEGARSRRSGR